MAKIDKTVTFKNATLNMNDMTLTEVGRDELIVHNLTEVLNMFDNVEGLNVTFKANDKFEDTVIEG